MALEHKIREAKEIIRSVKDKLETPLFLNFSGGKDSCCLVNLTLDITDDVECIYLESGLDLPGSIEFVKRQCDKFGLKLHITNPVKHYEGDFEYWLRKIGYFPSTDYTWCSSRLKFRPERAYLRKIYGCTPLYKCTGVRRFESNRRMRIYKLKSPVEEDPEHSGSFMVHPIINWTDNDVAGFLKSINFEINENYKPYGVSGCYYCPFYQPSIYKKILQGLPNIYDDIIRLENEFRKPAANGYQFIGRLKLAMIEQRDLDWCIENEKRGRS